MSYYAREEQETLYNYSPFDGFWRVYSTYPPDIRKILANATEITRKDEDDTGRVICVEARANQNQVRLFKPR